MKKLALITLTLGLSFSALADVPAFWPKQSSCEEIQNTIKQYGSVGINHKYFWGGTYTTYAYTERQNCEGFYMEEKVVVRTTDVRKCFVGYTCEYYSPSN